jgi:hypothetical protein
VGRGSGGAPLELRMEPSCVVRSCLLTTLPLRLAGGLLGLHPRALRPACDRRHVYPWQPELVQRCVVLAHSVCASRVGGEKDIKARLISDGAGRLFHPHGVRHDALVGSGARHRVAVCMAILPYFSAPPAQGCGSVTLTAGLR